MDGHTVEETHTMCMYVNMDDDLLVRFHSTLVLLVPSFSASNWGQRTVNSFTEQKRYDRPHPCTSTGGEWRLSLIQGLLLTSSALGIRQLLCRTRHKDPQMRRIKLGKGILECEWSSDLNKQEHYQARHQVRRRCKKMGVTPEKVTKAGQTLGL